VRQTTICHSKDALFIDPAQIFEYLKEVVYRIFAGIVDSPARFPNIIKMYLCLLCRSLSEKLDCDDREVIIQNLIVDIVFCKWLVNPLFICPSSAGILNNILVPKISMILLELSQFISCMLKKEQIILTSMRSWYTIFVEFVKSNFEEGSQFISTIREFNIVISPLSAKDAKLSTAHKACCVSSGLLFHI
jgi:hypothetical protein